MLVVAIVGALFLCEGLLRVFGVAKEGVPIRFVGGENTSMATVTDPELFWRLPPRGGWDYAHEIGVRGDAFSGARSDRDFRILCVGDSCTYGLQVFPHETWGQSLDRRIQVSTPAANVETVLAGAPGYSTYQNVVFLRRHARDLEADATILFVGVWNDMLPAAALRDSEYAAEIARLEHHPFWSLRLGRVIWRALHPLPTEQEMRRRFAGQNSIDRTGGARVSIPELRDNLRALIAFGRASGVVVAIVPSSKTAGFDWAPDYRRALAEVYRELSVSCIEADAAFAAYAARHPDLRVRPEDCLDRDLIHPTSTGHAALAEALEPLVESVAEKTLGRLRAAAPSPAVAVDSVEPRTLTAGLRGSLRVKGRGFAGPGAPRRALVNDQVVRAVRVVDDTTLDLDVEPQFLCRPGPLSVFLRSRDGLHRVERPPVVLPWAFELAAVHDPAGCTVRFSIDTESSLAIYVWLSGDLLAEGEVTRWGRFMLKDPAKPHPESAFHHPLTFEGLSLPRLECMPRATSREVAKNQIRLPAGLGKPGMPLYAQVLVRYGWGLDSAWLSPVITPVVTGAITGEKAESGK